MPSTPSRPAKSPSATATPPPCTSGGARRPLAACRAVLFASLVDDPSACPAEFPTEAAQEAERARLHELITRLVKWENSGDERLLNEARWEIARSVARARGETAPPADNPAAVLTYLGEQAQPIYDPFCGGGSIPLEAQRLGLKAVGSDLNPVAVLITKALIELPPQFANRPPVNPEAGGVDAKAPRRKGAKGIKGKNERIGLAASWRGAAGLADDIRYYGRRMRELAWERIGHLYPQATLPDGSQATVIAWLWARTVPCPNPACGIQMPLMRTFQLSTKSGNQSWTKPAVNRGTKTLSFVVQDHNGGVPEGGTVDRNGAVCVACNGATSLEYVREQSRAGNMGEQMTGIVAEGERKRLFVSPSDAQIQAATGAKPDWRPSGNLPERALGFRVQAYGLTHWHQLYTERQLTTTAKFIDLLAEIRPQLVGDGADADYADAVCTYLAFALNRVTSGSCKYTRWRNAVHFVDGVFARQAIPMVWDFAEANFFSNSSQNYFGHVEWVAEVVEQLPVNANKGLAIQADAATTIQAQGGPVIVTDPPYYDNIGYADLSDFFYVWLRPSLRNVHSDLFAGILVPKKEEMIASQFRFENPRERFEGLLNQTLRLIREHCSPDFPSSIFYAYKQQEEEREGRTSTGWETMLTALVNAGFQVVGTWPMRTELANRPNSLGANSLASSVVVVCRPRSEDAPVQNRQQFFDELNREMRAALDHLTRDGHIAPVDLAQAAIGPGMQIYSRYRRVETIGGEPVPVREALAAINHAIANYDERQEGEIDAATRFCLEWLKTYGYAAGVYGVAETLAQAKNVTVEGLAQQGLITAIGGMVQLVDAEDEGFYGDRQRRLSAEMTAWEGCFRMAWHLQVGEGRDGLAGAAAVARAMAGNAGPVERLARILYNYYDRRSDSANAVKFNSLVTRWPEITRQAQSPQQGSF